MGIKDDNKALNMAAQGLKNNSSVIACSHGLSRTSDCFS